MSQIHYVAHILMKGSWRLNQTKRKKHMIVLHIRYFPKTISSHEMCMKNDKELNVRVEGANLLALIIVKLSDMWSV